MMAPFRRRAHDEAGATMVEFALVSIVAFMLMLGMFQLGLVVLGNSAGSNAARDGARLGIIDYISADTTGSTNNSAIVAAVQEHLAGTVRNLAVTVKCLNGIPPHTQVPCNATSVDLTRGDLIEVKATWDHKGFGPFAPTLSRNSTARMVIGGAPDLTTPTSPTTTTTAPTTTTTTPGPAKYTVSSLQMKDINPTDGIADTVIATFSGSGSLANCTNTSMWTLANVPSGGGLQSVSVSSNVATLALNGSTKNTAVGSFTVAFSASGACTGVNNFTASAPQDAAGPVPISMVDVANGATDGKPEAGDAYRVTFSESVSPTWTSGSSVDVTFTRANSNGADTFVNIPNVVTGNFNTGAKGYVTPGTTVTFSGSTVTATGTNVSVTLGSCNSSCSGTEYGKGQFVYVPNTTILDLAGNPAVGSLSSGNNYELF